MLLAVVTQDNIRIYSYAHRGRQLHPIQLLLSLVWLLSSFLLAFFLIKDSTKKMVTKTFPFLSTDINFGYDEILFDFMWEDGFKGDGFKGEGSKVENLISVSTICTYSCK